MNEFPYMHDSILTLWTDIIIIPFAPKWFDYEPLDLYDIIHNGIIMWLLAVGVETKK